LIIAAATILLSKERSKEAPAEAPPEEESRPEDDYDK